jgi:hypothetical protein
LLGSCGWCHGYLQHHSSGGSRRLRKDPSL